MTLPNSVSICGKRIKIRVSTEIDEWGCYMHDRGEIILGTKALACDKLIIATLRHELMHAALNISGVAFAASLDEESVVRCLDEQFFPCWDRLLPKLLAAAK